MARLYTASLEDIRAGKVTDVYFERALATLRAEGVDKHVVAEITSSSLPEDYAWGLVVGLEEVVAALEGLPVDVDGLPEGSAFYPGEPVLRIAGQYGDFGVMETAVLGLLCQTSGVATKAARCKLAAAGRTVVSFGARRIHPAVAPTVERAAYVGGCDGVAVVRSAELLGLEPTGTMPHALMLVLGDLKSALLAFDRAMPDRVPRVALVDTFQDEKFAAVEAAEVLGEKLSAVRLDTPGNRRGNFAKLIEEVRWELDLRGHEQVSIFVSGGLDEHAIPELNPLCNGYGVGTAISHAPVINFALDLVEVEGRPRTKRGKKSGTKEVIQCSACGERRLVPRAEAYGACPCGGQWEPLLRPVLRRGELVEPLPGPQAMREYALAQVEQATKRAEANECE